MELSKRLPVQICLLHARISWSHDQETRGHGKLNFEFETPPLLICIPLIGYLNFFGQGIFFLQKKYSRDLMRFRWLLTVCTAEKRSW